MILSSICVYACVTCTLYIIYIYIYTLNRCHQLPVLPPISAGGIEATRHRRWRQARRTGDPGRNSRATSREREDKTAPVDHCRLVHIPPASAWSCGWNAVLCDSSDQGQHSGCVWSYDCQGIQQVSSSVFHRFFCSGWRAGASHVGEPDL